MFSSSHLIIMFFSHRQVLLRSHDDGVRRLLTSDIPEVTVMATSRLASPSVQFTPLSSLYSNPDAPTLSPYWCRWLQHINVSIDAPSSTLCPHLYLQLAGGPIMGQALSGAEPPLVFGQLNYWTVRLVNVHCVCLGFNCNTHIFSDRIHFDVKSFQV